MVSNEKVRDFQNRTVTDSRCPSANNSVTIGNVSRPSILSKCLSYVPRFRREQPSTPCVDKRSDDGSDSSDSESKSDDSLAARDDACVANATAVQITIAEDDEHASEHEDDREIGLQAEAPSVRFDLREKNEADLFLTPQNGRSSAPSRDASCNPITRPQATLDKEHISRRLRELRIEDRNDQCDDRADALRRQLLDSLPPTRPRSKSVRRAPSLIA